MHRFLRFVASGLIALLAETVLADDAVHAVPVACRALADSRVISAATIGTLLGDVQSFDRVQASLVATKQDFEADAALAEPATAELRPMLANMSANADLLLQRRQLVLQTHEQLRLVSRASNDLLESIETMTALMLQNGSSVVDINAALQVAMLSQRLGRSADAIIAWDGLRPEPIFLLGKDLKTAGMILAGLKDGDTNLRLHAQRLPVIREQLALSIGILGGMKVGDDSLLGRLRELSTAREAQAALQRETDRFAHGLAIACAGSDGGAAEPLRLPNQAPAPPVKNP